MKTLQALTTGLIALLFISHADAQIIIKKKSKAGVPSNQSDTFKVSKVKPKDDYGKMKTKSYSGYYDYRDERYYWDRELRRYYTVDKDGNHIYTDRWFQPY